MHLLLEGTRKMGKLGKRARKFAKKNLQSVLRKKRKFKAVIKRKTASGHMGNVENSYVLSSEGYANGISGVATLEAAASNISLDNIYDQADVELIDDGSDSESILSEDPDCPYISDVEFDDNDKENKEHTGLSKSNTSIQMEIIEKKQKLDRLLKKVPKFSEFLETRRTELENSNNEEIDSEEEGDAIYSNDSLVHEDMHLHNKRVINICTIDVWFWLVIEQPKGPALSNLLNAFRTTCRYGFDSVESRLHQIQDKKVFSKVLMFMLCEADGIFRKWLGVSDSCSNEGFLKLKNTSEWKLVRPLLKSYLRSCMLLLNQVIDSQILAFILSRIKPSIVFFVAFPSLTELLIKISVHLWVTGEESLSMSSFLVVREIASKLHSDWYDTCLRKTYKAFIGHSKFFKLGNLKQVEFLKDSVVELYSLDMQSSYQLALASLQQLANILSQAIKTKKKEELQKINNWQYINCIALWVKFVDCNLKDHNIQPLLSLSILIINGITHLFPSPRHLPLRFRCIRMLNQLSLSSGAFIPVASLILDCLDYKECAPDAADRVKGFDFSSVLKAPKHLLKSRHFIEECILSAIELLSAHFSQWRYHISFPELATIPLTLFKRFHEKLGSEKLRRQVKHFIDQMEQNKEYIERKRDETSFSPNDHAAIDSFLQLEKCGGSFCSFNQYYTSVLNKLHSRNS